MKKALIVQGGWDGHFPKETAAILERALCAKDFEVEVSDTLDAFKDEQKLERLDLIVPQWTMGRIEPDQLNPLLAAVKGGTGIGGIHGGMGDAFREQTEYQYMVGGQWVAHPGGAGVTYTVHIEDTAHEITAGMTDFEVTSEQYYMHIDPAIEVLATTRFGDVVMPVTWTKHYGKGRVFYCSLGHTPDVLELPEVLGMVTRGLVWAATREP
jgi:type 1 glutamine amidotransferase